MADEDDAAFLKRIGRPLAPPKATTTPASSSKGAQAAPSIAAPATPSEPARDRPVRPGMPVGMARGYGAAKALAGIPVGIGRLGSRIPGLADVVNNFRQSNPTIDRKLNELEEFADEPFGARTGSPTAEGAGYGVGLIGSSYFAPSMGLGKLAQYATAPKFMKGPWGSWWKPAMSPKAATTTMRAGTAADAATKGAVGGAILNPDNPGTGALGGAVTGPLPAAGAAALTSPAVKWGLSHAIPYALGVPLAHRLTQSFGIPQHLAHGIVPVLAWRGSPAAGALRLRINEIIDSTGRVVATIPPALLGYFGETTGEVAKAGGEVVDATAGDYARGVAEKTREYSR